MKTSLRAIALIIAVSLSPGFAPADEKAVNPRIHAIDVTQYEPDGLSMKNAGKFMPDTRVSRKMLHAGFYVSKPETARFYIDILGFREFWRGSADNKSASYSNLYAPEGDEYVEFMLAARAASKERLGTVNHVALEVPDMDAAVAKLNASPARRIIRGRSKSGRGGIISGSVISSIRMGIAWS